MKSQIKNIIFKCRKNIIRLYTLLFRSIFSIFHCNKDYKQIPIIINNFNRLEYLKCMIISLEKKGYNNIIILDNASTYPPLLNFYEICDYEIIRLENNLGHKALELSGLIKRFKKSYFVYTDPDLEIIDECPDDFLLQMLKHLKRYPKIDKLALSLKIDDLPDCYVKKQEVIDWESRFYTNKYNGLYKADVDTTFALYNLNSVIGYDDDDFACRTPYPLQCRHLPWYEDSSIISEEDKYYLEHKRKDVSWWMK